MKLIETLSTILDMPVREGKLRQYVGILDREGRITKKIQLEIILAICEKVIELEKPELLTSKQIDIPVFETPPVSEDLIDKAMTLRIKRQENIKKAQAARKLKYELKRTQ